MENIKLKTALKVITGRLPICKIGYSELLNLGLYRQTYTVTPYEIRKAVEKIIYDAIHKPQETADLPHFCPHCTPIGGVK